MSKVKYSFEKPQTPHTMTSLERIVQTAVADDTRLCCSSALWVISLALPKKKSCTLINSQLGAVVRSRTWT